VPEIFMLGRLKSKILDRLGMEVQRSTTLANFFSTRSIDLVVDAGANLGQFAQSIRQKGYQGRIHSFEPVGHVFDALSEFVASDQKWIATKAAVGAKTGTAEINVHGNHTLSSFLKATPLIANYDTDEASSVEIVPITTLDQALIHDSAKHIFLKVDVQGFERQVLEGARITLDRTDALYLELPIRHLYEGSWSFRSAINFIDDLGFEPAQFRTVSTQPNDPASALEFDCLFKRKVSSCTSIK
jgi:FkbM family methyltransferase